MSRLASSSMAKPQTNGKLELEEKDLSFLERAFYKLPEFEQYEAEDWQTDDIQYLEKRSWSANWSEMGVYKTSTALWMMERRLKDVENPRVLIITTKRGKGSYFSDLPKCLDVVNKWTVLNVGATGRTDMLLLGEKWVRHKKLFALPEKRTSPTIVLAHYHCFTNKAMARQLLEVEEWDFIICDEAHRMKDRHSQWTRHIKRLDGKNKHIMTGTGFINRPDEIWSLLHFLNRKLFSSYVNFSDTFCDIETYTGFPVVVGIKPGMEDEFRSLVRTVGPRRTKNGPDGVFEGRLHEPIFTARDVELNPIQRRMYDEIKSELFALDQQGVPIYSANVLALLSRLRQICVATPEVVRDYYHPDLDRHVQEIKLKEPSSKLDEVMELLEGMEWGNKIKQQVVIFSNFKGPIELAKTRFEKADIPYIHMTAQMNEHQQYHLWHDVFPQKKHRVFISTLQLGGESINLTPAEYCIFLDRSWSPKDNNQGIGRVYRPGQTKIPEVFWINAINTTDQRIERKLEMKEGWFNTIFGPEEA